MNADKHKLKVNSMDKQNKYPCSSLDHLRSSVAEIKIAQCTRRSITSAKPKNSSVGNSAPITAGIPYNRPK